MSNATIRQRGALRRVSAVDYASADETLRTAALLLVPEDQTQRQVFEKLMPNLYVLRNKGFSWAQLTKLLNECGLHLQPSTVRTYYSEMLAARMDICQARMNEQIAVMAAVRSETVGVDLSAISGRVQSFMQQQQKTALARMDALSPPATHSGSIEAEPGRRAVPAPAPTQRPKSIPAASAPPPPQNTEGESEGDGNAPAGEFGLLGLSGPSQQSQNAPAGFFTLDAEPAPQARPVAPPEPPKTVRREAQPPVRAQTTPAAAERAPVAVSQAGVASAPTQGVASKRTSPLQEGVPPLKRRDNVPAHVYEPGELEHPAIPGLMLSLEQRLYGASLEYFDEGGDEAGVIKVETPDQKRFRVVWRQTVPVTPTRTAASFTKMDQTLFSHQS
ncbi:MULTISPECIES: hypothetical protein [Cupriavidus]|jgi:hypothetical protein|uniref:hypothetical protein n=1 Tax=Cupriavidus TaxID=106589 RepID=UPI00046744E5|nr:hypothetical protein [Cupriavidus metallidurans]AVA38282.1 hypothetical protein C3Z06_32270 [Cupriavidus metallidurans]KWW32286.1 hypothetical protein AU374_05886 [Cupriavidus metallidurans]